MLLTRHKCAAKAVKTDCLTCPIKHSNKNSKNERLRFYSLGYSMCLAAWQDVKFRKQALVLPSQSFHPTYLTIPYVPLTFKSKYKPLVSRDTLTAASLQTRKLGKASLNSPKIYHNVLSGGAIQHFGLWNLLVHKTIHLDCKRMRLLKDRFYKPWPCWGHYESG